MRGAPSARCARRRPSRPSGARSARAASPSARGTPGRRFGGTPDAAGAGSADAAAMLRTTALALTLAACALLPAGASAATLTVDGGGNIHYTAAAGEDNGLSMNVLDVGYGIVRDSGVPGLTGCDTIGAAPG